ncbi:hypothetical protein GCM10009817_09450 [Terrabacter lapilli]|uniref:Uncharacterized protein n=1 Tax=Terrabacter lapilli TaxID=436231 RepID=A0ABN2RMZ7_9MICO
MIHQHNDVWQFIGDTKGTEENVQVLHFSHLLELDASLSQVLRLQPGGLITRMPIGWATLRFATDEAMDEYLGV